ncbi:MAG: hypothetical protein Q9184_003226 [Pyrenodesmia sp. 2 TL-2023]
MAPRSLQPYNAATFSASLTQIDRLVYALECIKNITKPCEPCMIHLIHEIASHLNSLLAIGPSKKIAEELMDMNHLTQLSRQLLKLDWLGVTSTIWTLVDRKISSLYDTRLAVPMRVSWNDGRNEATKEASVVVQGAGRRRRRQQTDLKVIQMDEDERLQWPTSLRGGISDFGVVEREMEGQAQEPRPPGSGISSFGVVERNVHQRIQEPRAHTPDFNVVQRATPGQTAPTARPSVPDRAGDRQVQQPRSLASDFEVVERSNTTPRIEEPVPRPSNFNAVERRVITEPTVPRASSSNPNMVERTAS